jgi:glucose-1-phosphate cytidylyltransferase
MGSVGTEFRKIPVVILCGGRGVLFNEELFEFHNKALTIIHGKPLVWWVIAHYALHGANEFVLVTGLQSEHFLDVLISAGAVCDGDSLGIRVGNIHCSVKLLPTPVEATTAARLLACKPLLGDVECFALTYSDTLSDADLSAQVRFHRQMRMVGTLMGVRYPVRFRILGIRNGEARVRAFAPRPVIESTLINGGYYLFTHDLWDPLYAIEPDVALENSPLEKLAAAGQLACFEHKGCWQHCDSDRDRVDLERLAVQLDDRVMSVSAL